MYFSGIKNSNKITYTLVILLA